MSRRFIQLLVTFTLALSTIGACQQPVTVEEIVARHIEAHGGQQKIAAIHSIVFRLSYREGDFVMPDGYMAKMRPYYKTLGDPKNLKVDVNEGFDGSAWEYYSDPGVVLRTVGAAAAATRHGTELIDSLADAGMLGARIELAGEEPFASKPAYKLHVILADGFEKDLFVDKQLFLSLGDRRAAPVHAFGAAVQSENRFGDYRPVNGVLFPFTIEEVEIATGKELNSVTMQSITENEDFALSHFSPPQFYGVEFIGYQMVKMGDFRGAIELLIANAADYPKSASAQYALGQAYKAAGDAANARASFQKALEIDPNFKKASDGLNALR
jgi:tetratricopeptide (TPR) repeat protein